MVGIVATPVLSQDKQPHKFYRSHIASRDQKPECYSGEQAQQDSEAGVMWL